MLRPRPLTVLVASTPEALFVRMRDDCARIQTPVAVGGMVPEEELRDWLRSQNYFSWKTADW
jgi:hypothetical protein